MHCVSIISSIIFYNYDMILQICNNVPKITSFRWQDDIFFQNLQSLPQWQPRSLVPVLWPDPGGLPRRLASVTFHFISNLPERLTSIRLRLFMSYSSLSSPAVGKPSKLESFFKIVNRLFVAKNVGPNFTELTTITLRLLIKDEQRDLTISPTWGLF